MFNANSRKQRAIPKGFALIVSLMLMTFMFILFTSLVCMTRIEVHTSSAAKIKTQAENNALLGLQVALGELQKFAGPDQRVTARADLEYGDANANAYWVGVYGSSIAPVYEATPEVIVSQLTATELVNDRGSSARLLNWLVSGNEAAFFNPQTDIGDDGEVVNAPASDEFNFLPDAIVTMPADVTANSHDIEIEDTQGKVHAARLMVGPGSVGNVAPQAYVVAPLVDLENNNSATTGRYAWWVGDEGVKARANLEMATTTEDRKNAFSNASRNAIELMDRAEAIDFDDIELSQGKLEAARIGDGYDPNGELERVVGLEDLALMSPDQNAFQSVIQYRYHDLTPFSLSVLSDTYAGGLKRDLSTLLDVSFTANSDDPTYDGNRLWTPHSGDTTGYAIPTWKHLKSFAQTHVDPDSNSVAVRLPAHDKVGTQDDVGVAPVLTYVSLGFRAAPGGNPAPGVDINLNFYPLVILWNPYDFTLEAPETSSGEGNFEVGIYPTWNVAVSLEVFDPGDITKYNEDGSEASTESYEWRSKASFDFQKDSDGSTNTFEFMRFRLNCPDIPPGQSLIFSLPASSSGDLYSDSNLPVLENIEPEPASYVSVPLSTFEEGEESLPFRLTSFNYWGNWAQTWQAKGKSLTDGKNGQMFVYLGEPSTDRVPMSNNLNNDSHLYDPTSSDLNWYQTHQGVGWDGNVVNRMALSKVLVEDTDDDGDRRILDESILYDEFASDEGGVSVMQGPELLYYDPPSDALPPAYTFVTQALFSGSGSNAQYNKGQFMFPTRWVAQGNMRAVRTGRTSRDKDFNVLFTATTGSEGVTTPWQKFQTDEGENSNRASAGSGHDWENGSPVDATLFEFPFGDEPLQSIGQLQHANLSLVGSYPAYPVGNSLADFRLNDQDSSTPVGYQLARVDGASSGGLQADMVGYYDISYLLNRTLWDQYFFSSVSATGTIPDELPNKRHRKYSDVDLRDPDVAAAGLMLEGGFNVNSTSEQAWRAVLGGLYQLQYDPENPGQPSMNQLGSAFPRFRRPTSDDDPNDPWQGYRTLTEEQIAQLAHNIVIEIKNRGPFTSLSDFVNRRLVDNPDTGDANANNESYEHEDFRGTLQAALDRTNVNFPANDPSLSFWAADELTDDLKANQISTHYEKEKIWGADEPARPYSNRSAFAPKYVTQGDILSAIGANLTARSDTFTIRACGEALDPLTSEVVSTAWCEAIVQRLPEYVNESDSPEDPATDETNRNFGRKFKIISFRWLTADEV
ncbi:hypothetical protein [Cerasicoccus maritimus]|uniref:hypothetical protein n=1 Tax=Cerasicoccus maritimus TaxID=490089 RepID=UPI002852603C|nr:hypothetical protein [Cerasicoccus maritimus]